MFPLKLASGSGRRVEVLCIGAHSDDIEIGCGGTVLLLQKHLPDCRVHWFVLTSDPDRRDEALAGFRAFVQAPHRGEVEVHGLPDGRLPAHFADVKARFESLKGLVAPDLVLTHRLDDRHQDHRLVGEVTWQTFRDHLIWEYEIPKYEGDLCTPQVYVPLPVTEARRKVSRIARTFASQRARSWFRPEYLEALMRLRGLECRASAGLAEAFHCRKSVFDLSPATGVRSRPGPRQRASKAR